MMSETLTLDEALTLLTRAEQDGDYRSRQKLLERAYFVLSSIDLPGDVAVLDRCIRGLTQAAKVHSFPDDIRRLRTKFLEQRSVLLDGEEPTVVEVAKGKLTFEGGAVGLYDEAFAAELADPDGWGAAQTAGRCLVVLLGGDGSCKGELRRLEGRLDLTAKELAGVLTSSDECVLSCPLGRLHFAGLGSVPRISLNVAPGMVVAAVHQVRTTLVALVAPTRRQPPNDPSLAEFSAV